MSGFVSFLRPLVCGLIGQDLQCWVSRCANLVRVCRYVSFVCFPSAIPVKDGLQADVMKILRRTVSDLAI
jgi:hypothetical protein